MFGKAPRKLLDNSIGTPDNVCPNTYTITDEHMFTRKNPVPFLTSASRKFQVQISTQALYYPQENRSKIKYGNSLQFTDERKTIIPLVYQRKPMRRICNCEELHKTCEKVNRAKGRLFVCRVPYTLQGKAPSIPFRHGLNGYMIENDQIIEVPPYDYDTTIGPAYYEVPSGELCYNTLKYSGCGWSKSKSKRVTVDIPEGPGPSDYDVMYKFWPDRDINEDIREHNRRTGKFMRFAEALQKDCIRQNLPGPGYYELVDSDKRRQMKTSGVKTDRPTTEATEEDTCESPGPQTYDPFEGFRVKKTFNVQQTPFLTQANRFRERIVVTPGPGLYEQHILPHPSYGEVHAAFGSSSERKSVFSGTDFITPGPDAYDTCRSTEEKKAVSVFKSVVPRFKGFIQRTSVGPYDYRGAYQCIHGRKSHNAGNVPFHSSENKFTKMYDFAGIRCGLDTPGVGAYNIIKPPSDILLRRRKMRQELQNCLKVMEPGQTSPPTKRPAEHLSVSDKQSIVNIFKTCEQNQPSGSKPEHVEFTATAAGVSVPSVYKVLREYKANHLLEAPKVYHRARPILDNVTEATKSALCFSIFGCV